MAFPCTEAYLNDLLGKKRKEFEEVSEDITELEAMKSELASARNDSHVTQQSPSLPGGDFEKLPWKTNKAGIQWVFANVAGAEGLVAKIGTVKGTTYVDGGWEYKLTGDSADPRKFLNRTKAK